VGIILSLLEEKVLKSDFQWTEIIEAISLANGKPC
jgi:hypothetical protein